MDRRTFTRQALITALASGPLRTLSRSGAAWASDDPVCGLPGGYCFGLYDNFDGMGAQQPDGSQLAVAGEFSPNLWGWVVGEDSEIVTCGGKLAQIAIDERGIPVSAYEDPALAMIGFYLVDGNDPMFVANLLTQAAQDVLFSPADFSKKMQALLSLSEVFSRDGHAATEYFRSGDLRQLNGIGEKELQAVRVIREKSPYRQGQGPRKVRFVALEDYQVMVGPSGHPDDREHWLDVREGDELGTIELIPRADLKLPTEGIRAHSESRLSSVQSSPRRTSGRRLTPLMPEYLPRPSGYVAKIASLVPGDKRLVMNNPVENQFAGFRSWSADVMIPNDPAASRKYFIGLDYHTSIPEQPPGISWLCGIGLLIDRDADYLGSYRYLRNKNTDVGFWEHISSEESGIELSKLSCWFNLRQDITRLGESDLRIDFFINGRHVYKCFPEDAEILLDPERLGSGPVRSFCLEKPYDDTRPAIAFIDNVRAAYGGRRWP